MMFPAISEIYGHPVIAIYDVNEPDFAVYVTVMIAYLCDIHPGGIWHSGTVDKDSGGSVISIDGRHIFLKNGAVSPPCQVLSEPC